MEDNKINKQDLANDPELNMGAHDPQVDLVRNKNLFRKSLFVAGGFVLILVIICTFNYCSSQRQKSNMSAADYAYVTSGNDSTAVANAMDMYAEIASKSSSTEAQRAKIISASYAYSKGEYEKALDFIKGVNTKSPVVQAAKYCLEGDCYVNLDKVDDGIKAFKSAVAEANDNPQLAPYALTKLANAYRFKGDYAKEAETWKELRLKFPDYNNMVDSDIARAEAMANQK